MRVQSFLTYSSCDSFTLDIGDIKLEMAEPRFTLPCVLGEKHFTFNVSDDDLKQDDKDLQSEESLLTKEEYLILTSCPLSIYLSGGSFYNFVSN
jgi:hypothetical protein